MKNNGMILSQGYKYILISFLITLFMEIIDFDILRNISFLLMIISIFIYRNPTRIIFKNSKSILSPVDATVSAIDVVNGKKKIYCRVTPCNVHVVRASSNTDIKIKKYQHGLNLNPNSYKASKLNEQIIFKFDNYKLQLVSGICNPDIEYTQSPSVLQGETIAIFVDGIAIITVKENIELDIKIGDSIKAGQSVLFTK